MRKCSEKDSLSTVIDIIVKAEVHRLIVTNDNQNVVGVISLSDILKHLVINPPGFDPSCLSDNLPSPAQQTLVYNLYENNSQQLPVVTELSSSPSFKDDTPMEVDISKLMNN